ncbi:predicted protein [Postia placenta Mad-698-R]|nr:predicted protein [Postia placenta Mad-698-R]
MSQNTNAPLMPPCGHSTAPTFDPSEVRSLWRYFQDLEALFTRCQITDEAAKKQWAVRYPSIDVADLWETIESFIDVAKSYNDWKADVRALYPGADDTRKWSLADMDQLIGERACIGIHNAADLGCYYRDFMAITKHLIAQHRLSTIEQSRAFLRGFQPALLARLETRLHLKHPDHYADDPYTMAEIHAAATFILHGTSSTPTTAANQATASTSNTSTMVPPRMIKTEDISMIIESLSRTIATLIQPTTHATHNHAPAPRQQAAIHIHENSGVEQTCHYCGNRGCRVGTCEFAEIDIRDGKFPKTSPVVTRSQAREAASRSAAENLDSSSRTQSTPSPTIPGDFDRNEEDEIDQELQDDFDEEPIPSTAEEHTSSPELLGLTTSDYDFSTPDLFKRSSSSPKPEDPIPAPSNLVLPTPSSFRAHAQPPIASSSRLSVIPTSDLAPPPPLTPSNAASNSNPAPPAPTIPSTTTTSSSSPAPTTTTNMSQNTNAPLMPPCGHSTAPTFDPSEVRSLWRYFQDLEALFTRCQITDEAAKKQWAVRYPSIDVADLWETIESFIDVAKSYNDWKADVRALYPGADDTRKWSLADMDQLIGERACIGIHNAADLGCYYRDFMAITKHLIAQHRLSTIEQSRAFLRGFQPALLARLETRLHLKHPDHYADDPYTMAEIHAAATFILHGTSSTPTTAANQATASTSNTSTMVPPGMIKTEDISMIIESLSRTIATLIQPTTHATHNHAPAPRQQAAIHIHENSGVEQTCHYCGNRGCRVGTCEFAEIDIRDGKCKRNTEGKIVLPNGSFCPRTIPGLTIWDRIYEWHRRNPTAPATPTMLFEIDDRSTMQTFTLNTSSRIEALERELLQLRKRREVFDGVEILQRKKPTTPAVPKSAEASGSGTSRGVAAPLSTSTSTAPPPTIPAAAPASSSSPPAQSTSHPITTSAPPAPPVHPFANARDATYAPPNVRNFATPPKPSNDKGKEPAYKTIVPVIQPKLAEEIFQRSMKSPFVTLTPEELLSIAPDVRNKYRDAVTPKRVSTEPVVSAHIVEIGADEVTAVNQLSVTSWYEGTVADHR